MAHFNSRPPMRARFGGPPLTRAEPPPAQAASQNSETAAETPVLTQPTAVEVATPTILNSPPSGVEPSCSPLLRTQTTDPGPIGSPSFAQLTRPASSQSMNSSLTEPGIKPLHRDPGNSSPREKPSDLRVSHHGIIPLCFLGSGAYGEVQLCLMNRSDFGAQGQNGWPVFAVKTMTNKTHSPFFQSRMDSNRVALKLKHCNIINSIDIIEDKTAHPPTQKLIMEVAVNGSLKDVSTWSQKKGAFTASFSKIDLVRSVGFQTLVGLLYLHTRPSPIYHRDVKPDNLLVDAAGRVRLCDFDAIFEKVVASGRDAVTQTGTSKFYAPEVTLGEAYSEQCDVWSLAVALMTLIDPAFSVDAAEVTIEVVANVIQRIRALLGGVPQPVPEVDPFAAEFGSGLEGEAAASSPVPPPGLDRTKPLDLLIDLLQSMLVIDPSKRITVEAALRHPFFDSKFFSPEYTPVPQDAKEPRLFTALNSANMPPAARRITGDPSQQGWDAVNWKELFTNPLNEDLAFNQIPYFAEYRHVFALRTWLHQGKYQDIYSKHEAQIRQSLPLPVSLAKALASQDPLGKRGPEK